MFRASLPLCDRIYLKIVDFARETDAVTRAPKGFNVVFEMGQGVKEMTVHELQDKLDETLSKNTRFGTTRTGRVFSASNAPVNKVVSNGQYIVTGNLRGGFIKPDERFGLRLSGYHGATTKPGLKWNGDEL